MNNRGKNRSFRCFRPISMEEAIKSDCKNCSRDPLFTYITVANKDLMIPAILSPLPEKASSISKVSSERETVCRSQKRTACKTLSRIAKAVFFETLLTKKIRNRKVGQDPYRCESNICEKIGKIPDMKSSRKSSKRYDSKIDSVSNSSLASNLIASSSLSSSSARSMVSTWPISESKRNLRSFSDGNKSLRSNSLDQKQSTISTVEPKQKKTIKIAINYISSTYLCLILISLFALIFWGRICAILYTSTWLYFLPTRTRRQTKDNTETEKFPEEIQSREYKKRVIMDGFLERNHSRI